MIEILFFIFLGIYFFVVGFPLLIALFPENLNPKIEMAPILGLALVSIVVPIAYRWGFSIDHIWVGLLAFSLLSIIFLIFQRKKKIAFKMLSLKKSLICLLGAFLLIIPSLVGGLNFSFFQGNHWDHFGYWESSIAYSKNTYKKVKEASKEEVLETPQLHKAGIDLSIRPTAHLIYSLVTKLFRNQMYKLHYTFLIFCFFLSSFALMFFLIQVFQVGTNLSLVIGFCFSLGFWGQYVLDINAWSHIVSFPSFLLLLSFVYLCLKEQKLKYFISLGFFVSSLLFIYPELLFFSTCPIGLTVLAFVLLKRSPPKVILPFIGALLGGLVTGFFFFEGTLGFVWDQLIFGATSTNNFWTYFQKYLFGQGDIANQLKESADLYLSKLGAQTKSEAVKSVDWVAFLKVFLLGQGNLGLIFMLIVNILVGGIGLFFLTPFEGMNPLFSIFYSVILLSFFVFLFYGFIKTIYMKIKDSSAIIFLVVILAGFSFEMLILLSKKQFWSFGKSLTYISPLLIVLFCLPLIIKSQKKAIKMGAVCYLAFQFLFAGYRVYSIGNSSNGVHYKYPPYPSIQKDALNAKTLYNWGSFEEILFATEECQNIQVEISDPWIRTFFMDSLYSIDKKAITSYPIKSSWSEGDVLGTQKIPSNVSCLISEIKGDTKIVVKLHKNGEKS